MSKPENQPLFSYGTLQLESVQLESFGRKLTGHKDQLIGYRKTLIEITDPEVLRQSGEKFHPIITPSGNQNDTVKGMVFMITQDELEAADRYEVDDYQRVKAPLASGGWAWVYIAK